MGAPYSVVLLWVVIAILLSIIIFYQLIQKSWEEIFNEKIDIRDVTYAFQIRRIRENEKTYTLIGVDEISVRISKEDFINYQVAVGKIWVYDGEEYDCVDLGQINFNF